MEQRARSGLRWIVLAVVVVVALPVAAVGVFRWKIDHDEATARRIVAARERAYEHTVLTRVVAQGTPRDVDALPELRRALDDLSITEDESSDERALGSQAVLARNAEALDALDRATSASKLTLTLGALADDVQRGAAFDMFVARARQRGGAACVHDAIDGLRLAQDLFLLDAASEEQIVQDGRVLLDCAANVPPEEIARAASAVRTLALAPPPLPATRAHDRAKRCADLVQSLDQTDHRGLVPPRARRALVYAALDQCPLREAETTEPGPGDARLESSTLVPREVALVLLTVAGRAPAPGDPLWAAPTGPRIRVTRDAEGDVEVLATRTPLDRDARASAPPPPRSVTFAYRPHATPRVGP